MNEAREKYDLIRELQKDILQLQGLVKPASGLPVRTGLGPMESAFPGGVFPTAAVHEFISYHKEHAAATSGFISGLLGRLMQSNGLCLWIGNKRTLFPAALNTFAVAADRIIFADVTSDKQALWAIEEALKCDGLATVVGELRELDFMQSRRLQLAVEESRVTGFIHRYNPRTENITACVTRWKITPLASSTIDDLPGMGHPCWQVQLQKVRNGRPGSWQLSWTQQGFQYITEPATIHRIAAIRKTG